MNNIYPECYGAFIAQSFMRRQNVPDARIGRPSHGSRHGTTALHVTSRVCVIGSALAVVGTVALLNGLRFGESVVFNWRSLLVTGLPRIWRITLHDDTVSVSTQVEERLQTCRYVWNRRTK